LLFSGRLIAAAEAAQIGLVNRVIAHDRLLDEVRQYACSLATECSPRSLRIMKRQLASNQLSDLGASIKEADREMIACFATAAFREGGASFLQKGPREFTGA